jgi:pimeloyl-ACP methyl ester carboxylesterase
VRFDDNKFGADVIAGRNPYAVNDRASLDRFFATVFHREEARPSVPWPADKAYIARRMRDAAFEQQVLTAIGRSDERFLPGSEAARIKQPTLLLWCRQDAVIDPSALALYAARIPQATGVLLDDCGHMSIMERPEDVAIAIDQLIERGQPR